MAVVKMKKLSLAALLDDRERLLDELMWLKSVDVSLPEDSGGDGTFLADYRLDEKETEDLAGEITALEAAEKILARYSAETPSIFKPAPQIFRADFDRFRKDDGGVLQTASRAIEIDARRTALQTEKNQKQLRQAVLSSWKDYPLLAGTEKTKSVCIVTGSLLPGDSAESVNRVFDEEDLAAEAFAVCPSAERPAVCVIGYLAEREKILSVLSARGFSSAPFAGLSGTVGDNLAAAGEALEAFEKEDALLEEELRGLAVRLPDVEKAYDILSSFQGQCELQTRLLRTEKCFVLSGYFPADQEKRLLEILDRFDCFYCCEEAKPEDDPPVLIRNGRFVRPFESVLRMYALPVYGGLDPTAAVTPFYILLFGIMLSDAGYGLVIALACALGLRLIKGKTTLKDSLRVYFWCGLSTAFWGFLFGTFFGDAVSVVSSTYFGSDFALKPIWFDPVKEPLTLLVISVAIGYIQSMAALLIKAYDLLRQKQFFSAFFDVGSWIFVLIGILLLVFGGTAAQVGKILALAGALFLVLTQGRAKKGIFGKLFGGIMSLYDITGFMSDILSYSRILALGLSAGIIGSVFNKLGAMMGGGILSFIMFVLVFVLGHTLNLALSALSSYVHTARLQFIEFFGRFYESGGREFSPFGTREKYSEVVSAGEAENLR